MVVHVIDENLYQKFLEAGLHELYKREDIHGKTVWTFNIESELPDELKKVCSTSACFSTPTMPMLF